MSVTVPSPQGGAIEGVKLCILSLRGEGQTNAAILLAQAVDEPDDAKARGLCFAARDELKRLEDDLRRAERPPFEDWYRKTWIRNDNSPSNVHRSYEHVQAFLQGAFPQN